MSRWIFLTLLHINVKKNLCMVFFKSCRFVLINNIGRRRSEHWWIFTETKSVMISGISYKYRHDIWNGDAVRSSTRSFRLKWRKHIGQLEEVQTEICKFETAAGISWKDSATRVATLLTAIGNDAIDVFNTLTWGEEGDEKKKKPTKQCPCGFSFTGVFRFLVWVLCIYFNILFSWNALYFLTAHWEAHCILA